MERIVKKPLKTLPGILIVAYLLRSYAPFDEGDMERNGCQSAAITEAYSIEFQDAAV